MGGGGVQKAFNVPVYIPVTLATNLQLPGLYISTSVTGTRHSLHPQVLTAAVSLGPAVINERDESSVMVGRGGQGSSLSFLPVNGI